MQSLDATIPLQKKPAGASASAADPEGGEALDRYFEEIAKKVEQNKKKGGEDQGKKEKSKEAGGEEEDKYDLLDSEGELDTEKYKQFKKRKIDALPEVDHTKRSYEKVRSVSPAC